METVSFLERYRGLPWYLAALFAGIASLCLTGTVFAISLAVIYSLPPAGSLGGAFAVAILILIVVLPNVLMPVFIASVTGLVNLHHPASWKTPTCAFVICLLTALLVLAANPSFRHSQIMLLVMLPAGGATWLAACWWLQKNTNTQITAM